jgi:hypothetical protein
MARVYDPGISVSFFTCPAGAGGPAPGPPDCLRSGRARPRFGSAGRDLGVSALCKVRMYGAMDVTKPYRFIGFGAMDVTKPYKCIGFGAMDVTKPYKFIGFGAMDVSIGWRGLTLRQMLASRPGLGPRLRRAVFGRQGSSSFAPTDP